MEGRASSVRTVMSGRAETVFYYPLTSTRPTGPNAMEGVSASHQQAR